MRRPIPVSHLHRGDRHVLVVSPDLSLQKKRIEQQAASILWHWPDILDQRRKMENGLFQLPENKSRFKSM
jgi:hypothetical protein